jgi:hypothetical protein
MRVAHQGAPVASLPTSYGNGFFSGLFGSSGQPQPVSQADEPDGAAPRPPGAIQTSSNVPAARSGGGMDSWLLDNLFGRR